MARRFGDIVRAARKAQKLTLDDLHARSRISKPYLSQIETGHAPPPEDAKVLHLEQELGFPPGRLLRAAHLERTPADIRIYIEQLRTENESLREKRVLGRHMGRIAEAGRKDAAADAMTAELAAETLGRLIPLLGRKRRLTAAGLDAKILRFPAGAAEEYVRCPGVTGEGIFAAVLSGAFMAQAYLNGDIVVFAETPRLTSGRDYLVCLDAKTCHFRRVFTENGSRVRLQPINPAHPATSVPRASVTSLHRALAVVRVLA